MPHRARPAHSWWLLTLTGLGGLSLCTVIAIWVGPETYREDITAETVGPGDLPVAVPKPA